MLQLIVDTAMELVSARYGALGGLDDDSNYLDRFIPVGLSPQGRTDLAGVEFPHGHGLLGRLITHPGRVPERFTSVPEGEPATSPWRLLPVAQTVKRLFGRSSFPHSRRTRRRNPWCQLVVE
ncbi:hypothetical protein [Streptomyces platensis]|uniref:hypothetical protein n=1 Tax=Streptomyces platensis TaxID=58346 RepID=UPI0033307C9F